MRSPRCLAAASSVALAVSSCTPAPSVEPAARTETPKQSPTWCAAIDAALGGISGARGFECLDVPNFLVTGFYGTTENPERSDFVNACFAGEADAAERLKMSVRPIGDLRFGYRAEHSVTASGQLDLGFLGPWAPKIGVTGAEVDSVVVNVELADAEIRVLSSVAEILGQAFRATDPEQAADVGAALRACVASLCDGSGESLVYTAKVLAAIPVIRLQLTSKQNRQASLSLAGITGFEVERSKGDARGFELRAHEKLNVAALLERAAPALEQAKTCDALRYAEARKTLVSGLRQLGLRTLAGRDPAGAAAETAELRGTLKRTPDAFSEHEHRDLLRCLEALDSATRDLSITPPTRSLCHTRDLFANLVSANGENNRLHDLLTDVAQPLHERLTKLANEYDLPCADPAFYRDADGDGFGNPKQMLRAPAAPKGYVVNSLDCHDSNPEARPGQTKYFDHARGDQSFDYDCDGRATLRTEVIAGGCKTITRFGIPIRCWAEPGWQGKPPTCGGQERWFATCEEGMLSCDEGPTETRRQECR